MKAEKKAEREAKKLADWLARAGKSAPEISAQDVYEAPINKNFEAESSLQAEMTIRWFNGSEHFREKNCQYCGKQFATMLPYVGNCSDRCRMLQLRDMGIEWTPNRVSRWGKIVSPVVPPEALVLLKELKNEQILSQPVSVEPELHEPSHQQMDDFQTVSDF